ncbi:siphovirus ReqiPepy6 Gp37-like family protein [Anoxybacillus flavithermus]|uniref:Phage related protein n=1 Tax=Anoxybacillus flavithermus (strain DSM 21510 / WK1) TaxID=491915 RepID=B7GIP2_ANOFW|nr:siphovirus ReqiPepy6 Gp37-like family protein [Anoxybacillus flavithermus]ACJ33057.1 Phage related protein [Anoxybacillus flavithermus WK1]
MKPIRILTSVLDLLAEIDDYESLLFTRRWHEVGEFELRINRHKRHAELLRRGNLIMLGASRNKVGIIKHREITLDEGGKASETWLVKGIALKGIVAQRLVVPPAGDSHDRANGTAETIMKHYVNNHVVNPTDVKRKIDMLVLASDQQRGSQISWESRFKNLAEELVEISKASGLGWDVILDFQQKKWIFDVYEGRNLTVNQTENPPVIFSPQFESLKQLSFVESDYNYKNYGYIAGQGEGEDRRVVEIGDAEGLSRIETFIDARDISEEDENQQALPEAEIIAKLQQRGQQKLAKFAQEFFLEGQILTNSPFEYEKDYNLGDIVTIQNREWGVTRDARITEIKEIYEPGGFQIEATFGESRPTLIKKLKQELAQISGEVRK